MRNGGRRGRGRLVVAFSLALVTALAGNADAGRGRSFAVGGRPLVINAAEGPAHAPSLTPTGQRARRLRAKVFGVETLVRLPSARGGRPINVAGRDVLVTQTSDGLGPADALYRVLQTAEAASTGRARSIQARLHPSLARRFGAGFIDLLLAGVGVDDVDHDPYRPGRRYAVPVEAPAASPETKVTRGSEVLVWGTPSHYKLLTSLGRRLKRYRRTVPHSLGRVKIDRSSGRPRFTAPENDDPRGKSVVLLQGKSVDSSEDYHAGLLDMLRIAHEARQAGASRVTAVLPYLPYSRSDRADEPGIAVGAALLPKLMRRVGIDRVVVYSIHMPQELGIFQALGIEVVHASGEQVLAARIADQLRAGAIDPADVVVGSPDVGGIKRADVFAKALAREFGLEHIRVSTPGIKKRTLAGDDVEKLTVDEDVTGKVVVGIDDETGTGTTLNKFAATMRQNGARSVIAAVSHLNGDGSGVGKGTLDKLFVLDTIPQNREVVRKNRKIEVVSIAGHLADVIRRLETDQSVESLSFFEKP